MPASIRPLSPPTAAQNAKTRTITPRSPMV